MCAVCYLKGQAVDRPPHTFQHLPYVCLHMLMRRARILREEGSLEEGVAGAGV